MQTSPVFISLQCWLIIISIVESIVASLVHYSYKKVTLNIEMIFIFFILYLVMHSADPEHSCECMHIAYGQVTIHRPTLKAVSLSFQPVLHDWCNKGRGMYYPVCGMVHIKEPLLLIDKSSLCGGSGFPFSLSEWSLTICLTPYNRR